MRGSQPFQSGGVRDGGREMERVSAKEREREIWRERWRDEERGLR